MDERTQYAYRPDFEQLRQHSYNRVTFAETTAKYTAHEWTASSTPKVIHDEPEALLFGLRRRHIDRLNWRCGSGCRHRSNRRNRNRRFGSADTESHADPDLVPDTRIPHGLHRQ